MAAALVLCGLAAFAFLTCVNIYIFDSARAHAKITLSSTITTKLRKSTTIKSVVNESDVFDECPFNPPSPWHKSILKYIDVKYGFDAECVVRNESEPVTQLVNRTIKLLPGKKHFTCKARCVRYHDDRNYKAGRWFYIDEHVFDCDFVETECNLNFRKNRFVHMQIVEKNYSSQPSKVQRGRNPDVHIILIDSVASTQIIRALPRTVNFLLHEMDAIEFRKLNKVGSNSRPNTFVILFGKTTEPIDKTIMGLNRTEEDLTFDEFCNQYLDNLSYIPFEYYTSGYKTIDAQNYFASLVNYPHCHGIKKKITHHTFRPFYNRIRKDEDLYRIHNKERCRNFDSYQLNYHSMFLKSYKEFPKFSFSIFHDWAHGLSEDLYKADYELYNYFLLHRQALSESFVFFISDHGPRNGMETRTSINKEERKNPFLYVVLPQRLRNSQMYEQVKANSREIITHHDIHSTLKDILYYQPVTNFTDLAYKDFDNSKRGSSLLRRFEAGVKRNCKTLPIPFQYCICQYNFSEVDDPELQLKVAEFAASRLSSILHFNNVSSSCEKIQLAKIWKVDQFFSRQMHKVQLFDVIFEVAPPAKGNFQTLVRMQSGKLISTGSTFTRLDRYGNMGDCMFNADLRPYCTCKT